MGFFKTAKRFLHNTKMELEGKPELYRAVKNLSNELENELKDQYLSLEIKTAAAQLKASLDDAIKLFDNKTEREITIIKYNVALQDFAEECHSAIHAHQPTLMSAPGFWNQIKASINNFLEQYFNAAPIFSTTMSNLAFHSEFMANFNQVKDILKPEEEAEEEVCCFKMN